MAEISVEIPEELETEFERIPKIELSILVSNALKERLYGVARFKRIVSNSKLTEEQAGKLADEISESLAKRYEELYPEG
ncbi:MAG: hypothetical protein JXB14_06380 [Candidatus Altiarchaeota archaeon]|nr:hypothetical protein [Candidatus Altiarchaeota archaeon]